MMPRTEPKIVANAQVPKRKTTAVKRTTDLMHVYRRHRSSWPGRRSPPIETGCLRGRTTQANPLPIKSRSANEIKSGGGTLQQAGGAREDSKPAQAAAGKWRRDAATRASAGGRKKDAGCDRG